MDVLFAIKGFSHKGLLRIHLRLHSEAGPYSCFKCDNTFKSAGVLGTHIASHIPDGAKQFGCTICEKKKN